MIEHLLDYKIKYIFAVVFLLIAGIFLYYNYMFPCVYGHHEQQWQSNYMYMNNRMQYLGGHYVDVFVCDCRTIRDSIK